jgi:hypothetical protein
MDHRTAGEVLRLDRLEKRARVYQERAMDAGKTARAIRAARLQTAVYVKMSKIVSGNVTTYSDRN